MLNFMSIPTTPIYDAHMREIGVAALLLRFEEARTWGAMRFIQGTPYSSSGLLYVSVPTGTMSHAPGPGEPAVRWPTEEEQLADQELIPFELQGGDPDWALIEGPAVDAAQRSN